MSQPDNNSTISDHWVWMKDFFPYRVICHNIFWDIMKPLRNNIEIITIAAKETISCDQHVQLEDEHPLNLVAISSALDYLTASNGTDTEILVFGSKNNPSSASERHGLQANINYHLLKNIVFEHPKSHIAYVPFNDGTEAMDRELAINFPNVQLISAWDEVRYFAQQSDIAYTIDAPKAILLPMQGKPLVVYGDPHYAGRGFTIDRGNIKPKVAMSFWQWFTKMAANHHYKLKVGDSALILSMWQLAAILLAFSDSNLRYAIFGGEKLIFPIDFKNGFYFDRILSRKSSEELRQWFQASLTTNPLGNLLWGIIQGKDLEVPLRELANITNPAFIEEISLRLSRTRAQGARMHGVSETKLQTSEDAESASVNKKPKQPVWPQDFLPFRHICHKMFWDIFEPFREYLKVNVIPAKDTIPDNRAEEEQELFPLDLNLIRQSLGRDSRAASGRPIALVFGSRHNSQANKGQFIAFRNNPNYELVRGAILRHPDALIGYIPLRRQPDPLDLKLIEEFPDVELIDNWEKIFSSSKQAVASYTYDAPQAIISQGVGGPLFIAGMPDYCSLESDVLEPNPAAPFLHWFTAISAYNYYEIILESLALKVNMWQLAAILYALSDPLMAALISGKRSLFPSFGPDYQFQFDKIFSQPQYAELGQWFYASLNTNPLGRFILAIIRNEDPAEPLRELYFEKGNLPPLDFINNLLNIMQIRMIHKYVPGIFSLYVDTLRSWQDADAEDYKNVFKLYDTCEYSFVHFSAPDLSEFVTFDRIPDEKDRSALLLQTIRYLAKTPWGYDRIEELIAQYAPQNDPDFIYNVANYFNMRMPESDSGKARFAIQKKYADLYLRLLNMQKPGTNNCLINLCLYYYLLQDTDKLIETFATLVSEITDLTPAKRAEDEIKYFADCAIRCWHILVGQNTIGLLGEIRGIIEPVLSDDRRLQIGVTPLQLSIKNKLQVQPEELSEYESNVERQLNRFLTESERRRDRDWANRNAALACSLLGEYASAVDYMKAIRDTNTFLFWRHYILGQKYAFLADASRIANSVPQPRNPRGVVFLNTCPPHADWFSAMAATVAVELKRRNYVVLNLASGALHNSPSGLPWLDKYAGIIPKDVTDGKIEKSWEVDLKNGICACEGINMFCAIYDRLTVIFRRASLDYDSPDLKKWLHTTLQRMDYCFRICEQIYGEVTVKHNLPTIFLSNDIHNGPTAVFRDFSYHWTKVDPRLRAVRISAPYESYGTSMHGVVASSLNAIDLTANQFCISPAQPPRDIFESWYQKEGNKPAIIELGKKLAANNIVGRNTEILSDAYYRIRQAKEEGKKVICMLGRLTCDFGLAVDGGPAHKDIFDWLWHTIEILRGREDTLLVIKPHPAEKHPDISSYYVQPLREMLPSELPDNVIYLEPDELNNWDIAAFLDLALTWVGTSTAELIAAGVPVMPCSHFGRHIYHFAEYYPENREQYAQFLKQREYQKPDPENSRRAAAFLHYISSPDVHFPYPYARTQLTNLSILSPQWNFEALRKFIEDGDSNIVGLVDNILHYVPAEAQ